MRVIYLDSFVDDAIDDTQRVEVEGNAIYGTIHNFFILLVEVIEKLRLLVSWQKVSAVVAR